MAVGVGAVASAQTQHAGSGRLGFEDDFSVREWIADGRRALHLEELDMPPVPPSARDRLVDNPEQEPSPTRAIEPNAARAPGARTAEGPLSTNQSHNLRERLKDGQRRVQAMNHGDLLIDDV